ncbi:MAG: PhzF family phenazine biosynthesis protein [Actinomycetota bacterium]
MTRLHVLRVFINEDGEWGNPLGVFLDAAGIPAARRQQIAAELGYSETVFVDDRRGGELRIFTPATELPFAGHPLVGTAWLLRRAGFPAAAALRSRCGSRPRRAADRRRRDLRLGLDRRRRRDDQGAGLRFGVRDTRGRGHRLGGACAVRATRACGDNQSGPGVGAGRPATWRWNGRGGRPGCARRSPRVRVTIAAASPPDICVQPVP